VAGFCEHGNEPSGLIKGVEFLLIDFQLLKKSKSTIRSILKKDSLQWSRKLWKVTKSKEVQLEP